MGIMGAPAFDIGPIGVPAGYTPPAVSAPPPPPPAPVVTEASTISVSKSGKIIPKGKYGNRLDTAAGRAAEAKALQEEQIRVASAALRVAESEKARGNEQAARDAQRLALNAANNAVNVNQQRSDPNFFEGVKKSAQPTAKQIVKGTSEGLKDFRDAIRNFDPTPSKPPPTKEDGGGGDGGDVIQPTIFRPTAPITTPSAPKPKIVKNPNRDVIDLSREDFSLSSISRLVFEQVGSIELANISRRDTIEGQNPYYELISNLSSIRKNFDPTSIISRQKSNQNISSNYTISLNDKIPDDQYLERNNLEDFYYIDTNGDLVIELDNLSTDEIIDFEISTSGTINLVDEA